MFYKYDKNRLTYIKVRWIPSALKVLSGMGLLFFILGMNFRFTPKENYSEHEIMVVMGKYNQFTAEKFINEIKSKNYKFPHIVFAQAKLETGNFTSKIFMQNHNLFGMREAIKRISTAKETQNKHAYYNNWRESLEDYGYYYCTYLNKFDTEEEYFDYLSQYYAEDPLYVHRLKQIIAKENLRKVFNVN